MPATADKTSPATIGSENGGDRPRETEWMTAAEAATSWRGPRARIAREMGWCGRSYERPGAGRLRRLEGVDPRRHLQSTWTKRVDSPGRDDVPAARRRLPQEVRRGQGIANRFRIQIPRQAAAGPLCFEADHEDSNFRH